ncbi:hypothetical protein BS47DRAFT_702107 [Hydnum rufescens UP504]|uniref:Nuclear pore localisation protein Npl4 ubiquitin-like domain-containing protein n=1 Tax=Hydnum rufescens UP504 TaxID=1448309 RepID=A0A9P6B2C3_9AGAM|nr:hypothetical protein BS47DRAFT_702107 [Hydnum rufescens UP504]
MLVRVRSKDGNFRFELDPNDDASMLFKKILETTVGADPNTITVSQVPRGGETYLNTLFGRSLSNLGLRHADLVFVTYKASDDTSTGEAFPSVAPARTLLPADADRGETSGALAKRSWESVVEDPVDLYWRQRDGKIPRNRDPTFANTGPTECVITACHWSPMIPRIKRVMRSSICPFMRTYVNSLPNRHHHLKQVLMEVWLSSPIPCWYMYRLSTQCHYTFSPIIPLNRSFGDRDPQYHRLVPGQLASNRKATFRVATRSVQAL